MKDEVIKEFTTLKGIGESRARALYEAGFKSFEDIDATTIEELTAVKGITRDTAEKIKNQVKQLIEEEKELEEEIKEAEIETAAKPEVGEEIVKTTSAELVMDPESIRLLHVRKRQKSKKPHFVQADQHKKKKLKDTWRRPKGLHNKKRTYILGKGELARVGYGSPAAVKGLHPSGFEEVLLYRKEDLDELDATKQAVRIARTIGQRKRMEIVDKARSLGLKIINPPLEQEEQ